MKKAINIICNLLIISMLLLYVIIAYYYFVIPDKFYLEDSSDSFGSTDIELSGPLKISISINPSEPAGGVKQAVQALKSLRQNGNADTQTAQLKLFGLTPIKEVEVQHTERPMLIPCGSPFGIKMTTDGAIVTGFGNVDSNVKSTSPAKEGGLQCGDIIKSVNGKKIEKNADIRTAVQLNDKYTKIIYSRDNVQSEIVIKPEKSKNDNLLKIGLWVRDSSAGIGTVTFFDSRTGTFGGLGHGVCDIDSGKLMPLSSGEAISVNISNVVKGEAGRPGELSGAFLSRVPIGIIETNTESGVFGHSEYPLTDSEPVPMAFKQEVKIGKATILTTISGNTPKEYDIVIEKIDYDETSKVKNMVLRVCDAQLLSTTGGIVQGMSGSPILQNGRLVGAVTHVFVNDATRGYGIFAENMYTAACQSMAQTTRTQAA